MHQPNNFSGIQLAFIAKSKSIFTDVVGVLITSEIYQIELNSSFNLTEYAAKILKNDIDSHDYINHFYIALALNNLIREFNKLHQYANFSHDEYARLNSILEFIDALHINLPDDIPSEDKVILAKSKQSTVTQLQLIKLDITKLMRDFFFSHHLSQILKDVKTERETVKQALISKVRSVTLQECHKLHDTLLVQHQSVLNTYYEIRKSQNFTSRFFGGSELGNALEAFIKNEMKLDVPHYIAKSTPTPDLARRSGSQHLVVKPGKKDAS